MPESVMAESAGARIAAVVAMAENNCIGKDNDLPWHIPADLRRFKDLTIGKPVIMGRRTFQSIYGRLGKPLPGRLNIVVTRGGGEFPEGVLVFGTLEAAIDAARKRARDEIIIGGGAQVYAQALPLTDRLYLTIVHRHVDGDAFFPAITPGEWDETPEGAFPAEAGRHPAYSYKRLDRRR